MLSIINNVVIVFVVINHMATIGIAKTILHRVGDAEYGWNQNLNYTLWSFSHHFHVGDWLYFGFDKRYYNVLEVNKTSYDDCNDKGFIKNITRGGRDVFELTEARPYYFLSSGGYCYHGMRVAVFVSPAAVATTSTSPALPPSPSPSPTLTLSPSTFPHNASPMSRNNQMNLFVMLSLIFFITILF